MDRPGPQQILAEMLSRGTLRALEKSAEEVCAITANTESSFADLSEVIMRDAALSTNLLTTANSVLYAGIEPVKTISAAVIRLGFEKIRSLALGLAIFKQAGHNARTPDLYRMYAGTYLAGSLAMELLRRKGLSNPEEGFVAGLLSQVPRLLVANTYPQQYREMERLMASEEIPFEEAFRRSFGLAYAVLQKSVLSHWHLADESFARIRTAPGEDPSLRESLVRDAGTLADLLFGNTPGDEDSLRRVEGHLAAALGDDGFTADELVRTTAERDANIHRFFRMTPKDAEMMVRIVQWGRVSTAQIAASLTLGSAQSEFAEEGEPPEIAIGNHLTEMMNLCRRGTDINHLLLVAQEAAFRCLRPTHVILALLDAGQTMLRGRFHAGRGAKVLPATFLVDMARRDSPIVQCMLARTPRRAEVEGEGWSLFPVQELAARHVLMAPIVAHEKAIGMQFLSRSEDIPFTGQEAAWCEAIAGVLGLAFERHR